MKRLIEKIVFSGFITAWRLATVPIRRSPLSLNATTDGVVRPPSAFSSTSGSPPSNIATHELVVPRSIPIVLPNLISSLCLLPSVWPEYRDLQDIKGQVRKSKSVYIRYAEQSKGHGRATTDRPEPRANWPVIDLLGPALRTKKPSPKGGFSRSPMTLSCRSFPGLNPRVRFRAGSSVCCRHLRGRSSRTR